MKPVARAARGALAPEPLRARMSAAPLKLAVEQVVPGLADAPPALTWARPSS